jgi:hypothetical protein
MMVLKDELRALLLHIHAAPDSGILDWEFNAKERIKLRELESNGLLRVLSYGSKTYWTLTPKGREVANDK